MHNRDAVSWNALMMAYLQSGNSQAALELLERMDVRANYRTFVIALMACTNQANSELNKRLCLEKGRLLHSRAFEAGNDSNVYVLTTLIDMYAKCGSPVEAQQVFDNLTCPKTVVLWNAMIQGYLVNQDYEAALRTFHCMDVQPDGRSFVAALTACANLAASSCVKDKWVEEGIHIHSIISRSNCYDEFVGSALLNMYLKCGKLTEACDLFNTMVEPDTPTWNAMIMGYVENGENEAALDCLKFMKSSGCTLNERTYLAGLMACTNLKCLEMGRNLCSESLENGCCDAFVESMLVHLYVKCGRLEEARAIFDKMSARTTACWNVMITGYNEAGRHDLAIKLFETMRCDKACAPDAITFIGALTGYAGVMALESGKQVENQVRELGLEDIKLSTCLVDFYGKCGDMNKAEQVFNSIGTKDEVAWNALLSGYALQGNSTKVFEIMQKIIDKEHATAISFIIVLTTCSHAGLVAKGEEYFQTMISKFAITPSIEHYTCMVDLYGRAGQFETALKFIEDMNIALECDVWITFLSTCRKLKNVAMGKLAYERVLKLNKKNAVAYLLMANIYGKAQMWDDQAEVLKSRVKARAHVQSAESWWTDETGNVHCFAPGQLQTKSTESKLKSLVVEMKKQGYSADLISVLRGGLSPKEKEAALCRHSEKLAIACALAKTPKSGEVIRITNTLRLCEDCHLASGIISKIEQRTIICRDATRLHVFEHGKCSCGDSW